MSKKHSLLAVVAGVFLLSTLPFLGTVSYGLINLDDYLYTVDKPQLTEAFAPSTARWLVSSVEDGIWMPVTRISYLFDFKVLGGSPQAMHAVSVGVHGVNGVLLFVLLLQLFAPAGVRRCGAGNLPVVMACGLGALVWSVHPLRVESVAWIASRKDVLFLCFELAALVLWVKRLDHAEGSGGSVAYGWAALAAFALSGMSKPMAMTFPVLAGLLELLKTPGRLRWRDYTAPVVMSCALALVALHAQRVGGATQALAHVPLYGRILNAAAAVGLYCWKSVCPTGLAVQCVNRWPDMPRFWLQGLFICGVYGSLLGILFWRLYGTSLKGVLSASATSGRLERGGSLRASPAVSYGYVLVFNTLTFFIIAIAPTLGISNFGIHAFADRFTYLPAIGFSLLVAGFLARSALLSRRWWQLGVAAVIVLLFGCLANRQARYWKDEKTLFTHTLEIDGENNVCANGIVGTYYYEVEHDLERALYYLERIFKNRRTDSLNDTHSVYIKVLAEAGRTGQAKEETRRYLEQLDRQINKDLKNVSLDTQRTTPASSYLLYAIIAFEEGDTESAKAHILKYEQLDPGSTWAAYLLGKIALREGDREGALRYWKKSVADRRLYIRHRFLEKEILRLETKQP